MGNGMRSVMRVWDRKHKREGRVLKERRKECVYVTAACRRGVILEATLGAAFCHARAADRGFEAAP